MKQLFVALFFFVLLFPFCYRGAVSAEILYDDFSAPYLDGEKWWPREYVREVNGGKLIFKFGNSSGTGAEVAPGIFRNNLPIAKPDTWKQNGKRLL